MDKTRRSLFRLRWRRCKRGYALSGDALVPKGSDYETYDPTQIVPPLHRQFGMLGARIIAATDSDPDERPPQYNDARVPFDLRYFENDREALLAFIDEYGLLVSDADGAKGSMEETIEDWRHFLLFFAAGPDTGDAANMPARWFNRYATPDMTIRIESVEGTDVQQIVVVPRNLLSWMWLQIAEEVTAAVTWGHCEYCGAEMARGGGPGNYRAHARFCKPVCRVLFHRAKKQQDLRKKERKK